MNRVYESKLDITQKTTEHNRIVHTGKYKTEVTNNKKTALPVVRLGGLQWGSVVGVWGQSPWSGGRCLPEAEVFSHQKTKELGKFTTLLSIL